MPIAFGMLHNRYISLHDARGRFLASIPPQPDWPVEKLSGLVAWETSHPDDRKLVASEWQAATVLGQRRQYRARDVNGRWYEVILWPVDCPPVAVICTSRAEPPILAKLTRRQREVFNLAVTGMTNTQIAEALGITVQRVANHRTAIARELQTPSATWHTLVR